MKKKLPKSTKSQTSASTEPSGVAQKKSIAKRPKHASAKRNLDGADRASAKTANNAVPVKQKSGSKSERRPARAEKLPSLTFAATSLVREEIYRPGMPFRLERLITPVEVGQEYVARKKQLDAEFAKARKTLKKYRSQLESRKDFLDGSITGVSVRFRTKFGQVVSPLQVAIVINVNRKRSPADLKKLGYQNFSEIDGVPVKVVEGSFSLLSESASFLRGLAQPMTPISLADSIVGGAAIAPPSNPSAFGTLGLVAISETKQPFGISCQHVVSNSVDQLDSDGRTRAIGSVKASRPPDKDFKRGTVTESLDCALFEFLRNPNVPLKFPDRGNWVHGFSGKIYLAGRRVNSSELDKPILKLGVGSGELMEGRIEALDRDVHINGVPYFNNYSVVLAEDSGRTFAVPGDSGSVLLVKALVDSRPAFVVIGILFARLDGDVAVKVGIACNMSYVLHALKLEREIPGLAIAKKWTYS